MQCQKCQNAMKHLIFKQFVTNVFRQTKLVTLVSIFILFEILKHKFFAAKIYTILNSRN